MLSITREFKNVIRYAILLLIIPFVSFCQTTWDITTVKQTGDVLNFKITANIPDQLNLMAMTGRNKSYFSGSALPIFIVAPKVENSETLKTDVQPNTNRVSVVKSYDTYSNTASFDGMVSFKDLKDEKVIQLRLIYVRLNANKKVETRSITFCF